MRQCGSTVEQLICNQWVAGSIPVTGSIGNSEAPLDAALLALKTNRRSIMDYYAEALKLHEEHQGKIEVISKVPV